MKKEALEALLQNHGWYLDMRTTYNTVVYTARKRVGNRVIGRYISTQRTIRKKTEKDVLEALTREPKRYIEPSEEEA